MHEYLRRIFQAQKHFDLKPGLHDIECQHDDWCGIYKQQECNCDPQITIRTPNGQYFRILKDGGLEQIILV